jgi:hypothetical protein
MKQINEIEDLSDHYEEESNLIDLNNEDLVQHIEIISDEISKDLQTNAE